MEAIRTETSDRLYITERFHFNPKEGIDNPAMIQVAESEKAIDPQPRLCVLRKEEGESFGFHLRVERGYAGHIFRKIVPLGPAQRAGVQDGDRLLEVNEAFVEDLEHAEVARRIHISGAPLCLLLLEGRAYEQALAQGVDLKALARAHRGDAWEPPRLCHIARGSNSCMGLKIAPVEGEKGKFSVSPASGGPAEVGGVRKGDRLVWLDGATVSDLSYSAISKMVKKSPNHMTVLVIDSKSEQSYAARRMPILPSMAQAHHLPHQPRKVTLIQGEDGYGFLLKEERSTSQHISHVVGEVDPGSPAERVGLQGGEVLLEVNGDLATHLTHEEVVGRIRQGGNQTTLTIITSQGQHFFKRLGLSPLLFIKESSATETPKAEVKPEPTETPSVLPLSPPDEARSPRLCTVNKGPSGYGFHLGCIIQQPGTFISQVAKDGPGEKAGLRRGDLLMEVNGVKVEHEYMEDVIVRIKDGGDSLSVLVMEPKGAEMPPQKCNDMPTSKGIETPPLNHSETPTLNCSDTPPAKGSETAPLKCSETPPLNRSDTPTLNGSKTPPQHRSETPPQNWSETPSPKGSETPPLKCSETPPLNRSDTPTLNGSETPPQHRSETPPQNRSETPTLNGSETPPQHRSETPPQNWSETPSPKGSETPPQNRSETPSPKGSEMPPLKRSETPPQNRSETPPPTGSGTPPLNRSETPSSNGNETPPKHRSEMPPPKSSETPLSPQELSKDQP